MAVLGQILAPASVRPGEACQLRVLAANNAPISDQDPTMTIDINGQVGAHQFLQFKGRGSHTVVATARDPQGRIIESIERQVLVEGDTLLFDTEQGVAIPLLRADPDLQEPYRFRFSVGVALPEGHPELRQAGAVSTDRRFTWRFGDEQAPEIVTRVPWLERDLLWDLDHRRLVSTIEVSCRVLPDGFEVKRTLTASSVPRLLRDRGWVAPVVRGDARAEVGDGTFTCALYIHNVLDVGLAIDGRSITPIEDDPDEEAPPREFERLGQPIDIPAGKIGVVVLQLRGGFDVPWRATGVTIRLAGTAEDGSPVRAAATFDLPLRPGELPRHGEVPPAEQWPWDDIEHDLSAALDQEQPTLGGVIVDRVTGTVGGSIAPTPEAQAALADLAEQIAQALRRPFEEKAMGGGTPAAALVLAASTQADPPGMQTLGLECTGIPQVDLVAEGGVCDPDNIPDPDQAAADAATLTCALSNEWVCGIRPGRWVNARKGDSILSPSDKWSLVADVLASVTPAQPFSHSGIMTRNFDEIVHSTASEEWLLHHLSDSFTADGSDGFDPEALRYLWPGAVVQGAQAAIEGEPWVAPDNGKTYQIASFSPGSGSASGFGYMPAMVVKPDPVQEAANPAVRATLHRVANDIRELAGQPARDGNPGRNSKSHYRFYCFTDARLSETEVVPAGHGWASGTFPSVCSVLIWRGMRAQNVHMEALTPTVSPADLEIEDTLRGAMVGPGTLDGLYRYTAEERQAAGRQLFGKIRRHAYEEAGWLGEALTDASDDTANQVVNAFANDGCDWKDSDEVLIPNDWRTTGPADGVAPANLLFWDGPDRGGVYGYAEIAVYRPPRFERYRLSRWRKYAANGEIKGTVKRPNGTPVKGATVQIVATRIGGSDAAGAYSITGVPYVIPEGSEYGLTATVIIDGQLHTATRTVLVNGPTTVADITLDAPPSMHRRVTLKASVVGGDDEDIEADESYSHANDPEDVELSRAVPVTVFGRGTDPTWRWGGEVRVEHWVEVALLPDASVGVSVKAWLYEGTSESTSDKDGEAGTVRKVVGPEATDVVKLRVENTSEDEPDTFSELTLEVTNKTW